jgi:hypothetical protein
VIEYKTVDGNFFCHKGGCVMAEHEINVAVFGINAPASSCGGG